MRLVTEIVESRQQIAVIDREHTLLGKLLKTHLASYSADVFYSPSAGGDLSKFDYVFIINPANPASFLEKDDLGSVIFIFISKKRLAKNFDHFVSKTAAKNRYKSIKIISLSADHPTDTDLEKILWFALSKSQERFLDMEFIARHNKLEKNELKTNHLKKGVFGNLTKKKMFVILASLIFFIHLLPFPTAFLSSYFLFKSSGAMREEKLDRAENYLRTAQISQNAARLAYLLARPGLAFFSLALWPDNLMDINEQGAIVIEKSMLVSKHLKEVSRLILATDRSAGDRSLILFRLAQISSGLNYLQDNLSFIAQKLPDIHPKLAGIKKELVQSAEIIRKTKGIVPHLKDIAGDRREVKYLLLFANNMEIRPGGGFIGSYGILTFKDLVFSDIKIYNVYDADGQLSEHIEPPPAIRLYLDQPNWFLRDSAFSPDFENNYIQAKFFLEKEMSQAGFAGGVLLTTTAIQNILSAFPDLHLPDFDEIINRDNFYIKAQIYSEHDFFPGSIQKKSFLGSLSKQLILNFEDVSAAKLFTSLKKSLDERQIVLAFEEPKIQSYIDSLYWSGKLINPVCTREPCTIDYIFPQDANLGVNKANFFVTRTLTQRIRINSEGAVNNTLIINYKNDSQNEIFPGGRYKNYLQVLLPKNAIVRRIIKNNTLVEQYDESVDIAKNIGFLLEVPSEKSAEVRIEYTLPAIPKGPSTYQLVVQKQIGAKNSDLNLEMILSKNIHLKDKNFSPLVNTGRIFYNTSLNQDKIFLLEMVRD